MAPVIRGNSFYLKRDSLTWRQGEEYAISIGGHLASVDDESEDSFLRNIFERGWIGYTDEATEGVWVWTNGSTSSYTNWDANQPDNSGSIQDYAQVWTQSGKWDDAEEDTEQQAEDYNKRAIIEIPLTSSITFSSTPKEGAGLFTTSINLSAGTSESGNLAEGAIVYWKVRGIDADDLASGELSGNGTISSGKLDLQHSLTRDSDTGESFEVSVFSDAEMTQQIGVTQSEVVSEGPKVFARGNSLYTIVDGPSWTQAEANSVKLGGHLVTINDAKENKWLAENYASFGQRYNGTEKWLLNAWIGFTDSANEGEWKWSSGENSSFTGWGPGEPSDYALPAETPYELTDRTEDFAHIILPDVGGWRYDFGVYWNSAYNRAHMLHGGSTPEINGIAETPFIRRGDSAYVIVQGPTWEEAEANAVKLGGHLVTINDAAENEWISNQNWKENGKSIWIGASDKEQEGVWKWSDGSNFDYANWGNGAPNGGVADEDYAQIPFGGEWNGKVWNDDYNGDTRFGFVTNSGSQK